MPSDGRVPEGVEEKALLRPDPAWGERQERRQALDGEDEATLRAVVGTSNASRKNHTPAMRQTHESACQETTSRKYRRGS